MIIVVDDDKDILEANVMILKSRYGIEKLGSTHIVPFSDPNHALDFIKEVVKGTRKARIDLVITDYNMPEMNGVELAIEIRAILPLVPIIFYSSDYHDDMDELFKNSEYVKKGGTSYRSLIDEVEYLLKVNV